MSCSINLHVENTTGIKSLAAYCGTNIKSLVQMIKLATSGLNEEGVYVPSEEFNNYCTEKYGKTLDLNGNNPEEIRDAIVEFYKDSIPSLKDSINDDRAKNKLIAYGYSSASARDDGKKVIISRLSVEHIDDLFERKPDSDEAKNRILYRANLLARSIVFDSNLSKEEKNVVLNAISKSNSIDAIREHLSAHNLKANFDIYSKNPDYYKQICKKYFNEELAKRIALNSGEPIESVARKMHQVVEDENGKKTLCVNMAYCEKALGDKNMSLNDKNLLATYVELIENTDDYFEELTRNSKLEFLRKDRTDDLNDQNEQEAANAVADEDTEGNDNDDEGLSDDELPITIGMYDHSGTFKSAMIHVNKDIKAYLDSIPALNSKNKIGDRLDYDLDNALGMPTTMDANQIATVLYHYASRTDVNEFIQSIKDIADTMPGFAGLHILADFLSKDLNAAFGFYTCFGKLVMSKVQLNQEDGVREFVISNKKSSKIDAFRQELLNSVRGAIPRQDVEYNNNLISELETYLNNTGKAIAKNPKSSLAQGAVERICKILKHYYTNIEDYSIENFIYKHKNSNGIVDVVGNIGILITKAKDTVKYSEDSQKKYDDMIDAMSAAYKANKAIDKKAREDAEMGIVQTNKEEKTDVLSLYSKDYLTEEQISTLIDLSDLLIDYSLVKVESNSLNPLGNQSSDVINSSFLTRMMQVLNDNVILGKYGNFKFKSQQYNFSNILLEQKDDNGKIISYGLFIKNDDGTVTPTSYAKELLSFSLYGGARNYDEEKGITYPNHSKPDYIATQFAAFYQKEKKNYEGIAFAAYMTRTPSDAPKNFVIYAPRYSANGLFKMSNSVEINSRKEALKAEILGKRFSGDLKIIGDNKTIIKIDRKDSVVNHITRDGGNIVLPSWVGKTLENDKEYTLKFQYKQEDAKSTTDTYLISGILKDGVLTNTRFDGFYEGDVSLDIKDELDNSILKQFEKEGVIKRTINTNHNLVRQLRNVFKQELLDMAIGINKFFITDSSGLILRYTEDDVKRLAKEGIKVKAGDIIWKDNISHDGRKVDGAYDNYHYKAKEENGKKVGYIIAKEIIDEKGNKGWISDEGKVTWFDGTDAKLRKGFETGNDIGVGNVFHSDRFTVFDENNNVVRNYGEELINEIFNPLYGGAEGNYIQVIRNKNGDIVDDKGDIVDVKLDDDATIDKINAKLVEFIQNITSDAYSRLESFENIIGKENLNYEKIAEFMINYHLFYCNSNDIFEGDSKFYKDAQTFLKRAKEIQGSGVPYGIASFANAFTTSKEIVSSRLASTKFYGGHKVKQFNKFVGVTIVNTVLANQKTLETLVKQLVKNGMKLEQAEALMSGFGYKNPKKETTVNDAQSYITFDEWIRRISARGQLTKYKPLIDKIYSGKELNGAELSEFVQVQKNFYYDQNFDSKSNIFAPRQIKNAEFVLIPQLIKGTELEVVAKLMEKYGIDQLNTEETSKAGKTNTLSIFDAKTGKVHQDIIDEVNGKDISEFGRTLSEDGRGKQLFGYEFLYTQQETPQHIDTENKAGIQVVKKFMDNINPEDEELYAFKQKFIKSYVANIKESAKDLFTELGIKLDKNGNPKIKYNAKGEAIIEGLKYSVFYDKLKSEIFRLGYDSNMLDYVTLNSIKPDENGNVTIMPNYMSMVGQKLENIAQSLFNHAITRQKLPGFHAAQITNIGFRATGEHVSYSNELRYHTDEKGNYVDYVEIMLPASAFHFKRRNTDGSLKTKEELLKELQDAELDYVIGYRIPTEGKQSICKMKVVGFIYDAYGSTIVVPNEWVAQTGSDFDIDSVYGIQHSTYVDENGHIRKHKLDTSKTLEANTKDARDNEIVDAMLGILSHPDTLEENLSHSNFEDITDARNNIYDMMKSSAATNRRNNRSVYNVLDQADQQEDAMSGYKLKGFSVTRDNFVSVCNTVHPIISNEYAVDIIYPISQISYEDAVKRFGEENVSKWGKEHIKITHNRIGWSLDKKNVVGKLLTCYSSQTTAHILDAIKEGFIPNVNDFTFGVYKLFPDLGIDYETAIAFMMQNGVSRIVKAYNNSKSIYLNDVDKPIPAAIREIAKELNLPIKDWTSAKEILKLINKKYSNEIKKLFNVDALFFEQGFALDKEKLIDNLTSPVEDKIEKCLYDLKNILIYNRLKTLADEIGNLARVCNPDKFGAKQTIFATNKVFDDIKSMLDSDRKNILTVDGKHFLKAIYPDVEKGIEGYLSSTNNDSKYEILHTFLKTSTAPSVIINRMLFRTQSAEFRNFVNKFEDMLSNGSKLNETQAKNFEKYIISYLYSQCESINLPLTYIKANKRDVWGSIIPKGIPADQIDEIIREYKEEERARVFGFRMEPEPTMIIEVNGVEKVVPFEIKDFSNITQKEINAFALLTPAQKVAYIQENFRDTGIFGALSVNLFHVRDISGKKAGSQTIEFVEDIISKEDAYIQLVEAFTNRNPLIALAAYDLIKYAFIVEGYKMSKRGISKIIPNTLLYSKHGIAGTGLVTELNSQFVKLEENLRHKDDSAYIDYVRGHFKSLNIPFKYVTKTDKKSYELIRKNGMILIPFTEENKQLLGKYKITYTKGANADQSFNNFVRLKFGQEDEVLYRIIKSDKGVVLYPLNPLEENEHGDFSSNPNYWKFPKKDYYEKIITDLENSTFDDKGIKLIASNYKIEDYKHTENKIAKERHGSKDFEIGDSGTEHLINEAQNFYSHANNAEEIMYLTDRFLEDHIKSYKRSSKLSKIIPINHTENGETYVEYKPVNIYKLKPNEVYYSIQKYLGEGKNKEIANKHKRYTHIIQNLREAGITTVVRSVVKEKNGAKMFSLEPIIDIYAVDPKVIKATVSVGSNNKATGLKTSRLTEGRNATAEDVAGDIYRSVSRVIASDNADEDTLKLRQYWNDKSIKFDKTSIETNLFNIIRSGSEYITKRVEHITNKLKYFIKDPNGDGYLAVNSPEVMEMVSKNPALRNELLHLILEAEAIVANNMSVLELDIKAQDSNLQTYLNKIKAKLQELQNSNIIAEAQNMFANEVLKTFSTNPLIKRDLLNVIDGFYSATWLESWIGDLQETPNPMIQIIAKEVTSDIFAKQKLAQQRVLDFEGAIATLRAEASAAGKDFDLNHIIKNGRFVQDFLPKLIEDRDNLRNDVINAREAYNNGKGDFRTYLEAKLAYDKWKLEHINQELDDDYYRRRIKLEEEMLHGHKPTKEEIAMGAMPEGTTGFPDAFVKYKELEARRRDLYSHTVNGYLDQYYLDELDKVNKEINNLIEESYLNPLTGEVEPRETYDKFFNPITGTEEQKRIKRIYSASARAALVNYLKELRELNDEYYHTVTEFGFDEELAKNLRIINDYEKRDANGNITVPIATLMEHPEYVAAKEWVAHNAKFVMNSEQRDELNEAFAKLRKKDKGRKQLNNIVKEHNARDIYGDIDAREFTEDEIARIKKEQLTDQTYHEGNSYSDRPLIKNGSPSPTIYKAEFYSHLTTGGVKNTDYTDVVEQINKILERYWDNETKTVRFDWIPDTEEGIATLNKLNDLYNKLIGTKRREGATEEEVEKIIKFREENVDTELTEEEKRTFEAQKLIAEGKSARYQTAWNNVNYIVVDGLRQPNYYIYGSLHPKAEVADKWIDKERTAAVNLINSTYMSVPTQYYYEKVDEMSKKGKEAFTKWYYDNHVFNASTNGYEPIRCWTTFRYRDTSKAKGEWIPTWENTRNEMKPSKKNKNYIENVGHAMNYKKGTGYDNPEALNQNEFERKAKTYIQDLLYSLVHTDKGLQYLKSGWIPSQHKAEDIDAKFIGKEFLKALGWTSYHTGKERFHNDVGYDTDKTIEMPMLALLDQRTPKELGLVEPVKQEDETEEAFAARQAKYQEDIKKLREDNEKAHQAAINDDWESVIKSFILQASHFNAIQDNKYMLFYGKRMLQKTETYISKYGGISDFQIDNLNSTEENPDYKSKKEDNLIKQYENWVRRLVYDEWKEPRSRLTKWASRLQSLTSAQYMMMNVRGGIANVTLGETQIIAEAFAREYFGTKAWAKGSALWNSSIISQFADLNSDKASSLANAIIRWFNVVDYDETTGKSRIVVNPTMEGFNKFNRAMYSPQTIGENFMQNSAMFAMLYDHHVYVELDPKTNKQTIVFKNREEAIRDCDINTMLSVLNDEQKVRFNKMIDEAKADANVMKEYAWYRKDFVNEFFRHGGLSNEQQKQYLARKKDAIKKAEEDFNKQPSIMDQLELGEDGHMRIKKDSIMGKPEFNSTDAEHPVSDALKLLADFRGRVISVNKKIHGVYDKLGQAQLEKKWYGSLVMQYHKHIYPGMMKRWRVKGMYNEQRGTIEKGSYISLMQFLATPFKEIKFAKSLSEGERNALQSIQNIFREIFDFCTHVGMYWSALPEYDKANIRRNMGDLMGVLSAILLVMALRAAGDDDNKESIWYNLALYEADRLASESFQFNPYGAYVEGKKLWSTPIAAQSGLQDLISTMGFITDWLFDEDFDPNYQSGRFAGENKFLVRLKRRIPIYRGISTSFLEITESNHYYKVGNNVLDSQIVENIMSWVDDED